MKTQNITTLKIIYIIKICNNNDNNSSNKNNKFRHNIKFVNKYLYLLSIHQTFSPKVDCHTVSQIKKY